MREEKGSGKEGKGREKDKNQAPLAGVSVI